MKKSILELKNKLSKKTVPLNCFCSSFLSTPSMWLRHRLNMLFEAACLKAKMLLAMNINNLKKGNKTMKLLYFFLVKGI